MKKLILMSVLIVCSFSVFSQDQKTRDYLDQKKKEISRLKQDRNQENDEMKSHQKNVKFMDAQIKEREKIIKSIVKAEKTDKKSKK